MGAQLGSSVTFGSGCGQAFPGVPRKAPLCWLCESLKWTQEWALFEGAAELHSLEAGCLAEFGIKLVADSE